MCVSIPFDEKIASDRQRNVVFHLPDIPLRESSVSADSALFDRAGSARSSYQHAQLLACLTRGSELHHRYCATNASMITRLEPTAAERQQQMTCNACRWENLRLALLAGSY